MPVSSKDGLLYRQGVLSFSCGKLKRLISDIFAKKGEGYFRRAEKQILKEVAKEKKFVVACGGGIVIDEDNIKLMKKTGTIVCLTATPAVIYARTCRDTRRPLLNVADPKEQIELLMKMRSEYYAKADKTIDTSHKSIKDVVAQILKPALKKCAKQIYRKARS